MADYQSLIQVGIQGLNQIKDLEKTIKASVSAAIELEARLDSIEEKQRRVGRRTAGRTRDLGAALNTIVDTDQGRNARGQILPGASPAERRAAAQGLRRAELRLKAEDRSAAALERARRLYIATLKRVNTLTGQTVPRLEFASGGLEVVLGKIGRESRDNRLVNLFGSRQRALTRGGGGRNLSANPAENARLQEQIRQNRAAFDLARGANNLPVMSRLATELSGLVQQQNEFNRIRTGRSVSFEAGRRGQEKITELSRMPGADPSRIRRLRGQATEVIAAGYAEDIAGARNATRRMKDSIGRYERELNAAATDLANQRRAGIRGLDTRLQWGSIAEEARQRAEQNRRALPDKNLLAQRIARTPGGVAPVRLDEMQEAERKRLEQERKDLEKSRQRWNYNKKLQEEEARRAKLGIGTVEPMRIGGPARRVSAIPMTGGAESGILPRALPSDKMLAQRIGLSGQRMPTRLDELKAAEEKRLAEEAKEAAGSLGRFGEAVEREAKRRQKLGIGEPERVGGPARRTGAIPMGGTAVPFRTQEEIKAQIGGLRQREGWRQFLEEDAPRERGRFQADAERERKQRQRELDRQQRESERQQRQQQRESERQRKQSRLFQGSPRKALGEGLIGGAFPLLFGQGVGASIGGFAGGFGGGLLGGSFGFGLSLIGTALGSVVDTTIGKLGSLGGALGSASDSIDALAEAGFKVRDSQKIQISQLEKVGRGYEAQQVALREIESRLGPGSVAQIEKLNDAQKELADSWAALSLQLGTTLIPVVVEAANAINSLLGGRQAEAGSSGGEIKTRKPRKPSEVLADIDAAIAFNESKKAGNREYVSLVREVEDWRRDNEEKIFTMRRQGADIEKEKSNLRLDVENKIFSMRQETARLEIDNARSRAQLAIESFDLELARRSDALGGGGGEFIDQVREYLRVRGQGESELQAKEKIGKLEIAAKERELQQYVLQVADKVAAINRTVEDYKRDQAKFRFEASRRQEDYRIKVEDYIYNRFKERYEYAIGSEQEILRIRMEAAAQMGAMLPPDAGQVLGSAGMGQTTPGISGLASPVGPQRSGRPVNWNQGLDAGRGHEGQDIGVDVGTTIHAIEDAVVEGVIKGFGKVGDAVMLRYSKSGQLGVYGHINPGVTVGQRVAAGQQIGVVTPDIRRDGSNNTHLHYESWRRSRGAGNLLDPAQRLRSAIYNRRVGPPSSVTPTQRRQGPTMLVPPASGPVPQFGIPTTTDSMFDRRSALPSAEFDISKIVDQNAFEDVAQGGRGGARAVRKRYTEGWITVPGKGKRWRTADGRYFDQPPFNPLQRLGGALSSGVRRVGAAITSSAPYQFARDQVAVPLLDRAMEAGVVPAKEGMFARFLTGTEKPLRRIPADVRKAESFVDERLRAPLTAQEKELLALKKEVKAWAARSNVLTRQNEMYNMYGVGQPPSNQDLQEVQNQQKALEQRLKKVNPGALGISEAISNVRVDFLEGRMQYDPLNYTRSGYIGRDPNAVGNLLDVTPEQQNLIDKGLKNTLGRYAVENGRTVGERYDFNSYTKERPGTKPVILGVFGDDQNETQSKAAEAALRFADQFGLIRPGAGYPVEFQFRQPNKRGQEGAALPGGGFNMASLSKLQQNYGESAGPVQLPSSMRVDAPSTVPRDQWRQPTVPFPAAIPTIPFTGNLPTYAPAPMAAPVAPADPVLPPSPAPMVLPDIRPLTQELNKQKDEIMMSIELMKKLQEVEKGRLLLQLTSTKEVRGRLNDAARELFMETEMLSIDKSRSDNEQEIRAEKIRTRMALGDLNSLEELSVGFANDMLRAGKLQQQEYDQVVQGLQSRMVYEKELLDIVEQRAEVAREEAFMQRLGDVQRETRLTGAGLRAGLVGTGARAFEEEMRLTGDMDKATQRANAAKALEDQQLIWGRLEQNIVDVSEAISGGLTNGLLDIIDGSRRVEEVGRDVLRSMANSFAESAQQQLSTLMQRKLGGMLGGPEGMLTKLIGGGTEAAGAQALGLASMTAAGQVAFFGATLQTVAAQAALSGAMGGGSSLLGSAIPSLVSGFAPGAFSFGGFFAEGGVTTPGKGYVVGDGGEPEFFFPGVTGRVVPRSDMEKAAALQDQGGSSETIDLRYEATEIRGERYVTEAQFRRSNAMLLARSQAATYSGMRGNKEVREFVGI